MEFGKIDEKGGHTHVHTPCQYSMIMNTEEGTSLVTDDQDDFAIDAYEEQQLVEIKQADPRARKIILGFECFDSTAANGVANNLVVYLQTILHGGSASNAVSVTTWYGASYFVPIVAAVVADTYWGRYKIILLSLVLYLIGTSFVALAAFLIKQYQSNCDANLCDSTNGFYNTLFFMGLYLVAFGVGGIRSSLLPFGADQFDDDDSKEREQQQQFFSWFYMCLNFGVISSGISIIWIQNNVSWALGFSISTLCVAVAFGMFALGTPKYRLKVPTGSPLKSLYRVLACFLKNMKMKIPTDTSLLYEDDDDKGTKLEHTDDYRLLDKAAILSEAPDAEKPLGICTVTQVEEFKILLRLLPIWACGIVYSAAYFQMWTTFIQQGTTMDTRLMSVSVPSASLASFEVVCVMIWVLVYNKIIVPKLSTKPTKLQRIGIGYFLMILTMAVAGFMESKRLKNARNGTFISIAWQLPQYCIIAASEVFTYITQLEFFYDEAPESMKSMCTSFSLLAISLGNYLSSLIVTVVTIITSRGGNPGWIPDDLNDGHLDYFFWSLSCLSLVNLAVYVAFARRYKLKRIAVEL